MEDLTAMMEFKNNISTDDPKKKTNRNEPLVEGDRFSKNVIEGLIDSGEMLIHAHNRGEHLTAMREFKSSISTDDAKKKTNGKVQLVENC